MDSGRIGPDVEDGAMRRMAPTLPVNASAWMAPFTVIVPVAAMRMAPEPGALYPPEPPMSGRMRSLP